MVLESLDVGSLFANLQSLGFYDYLLPFLLVFTIIFAMLEKTKLMGLEGDKPRTNINTLLALVIGLIVVVQTTIVQIINNYLSKMALFIIIVLIFLLVLGIFGADVAGGFHGTALGIIFFIAIIAVVWALSPDLGFGDMFSRYYNFTETDKAALLMIVVIGGVIWLVTRQPRPAGAARQPNILEQIGASLRGGGAARP